MDYALPFRGITMVEVVTKPSADDIRQADAEFGHLCPTPRKGQIGFSTDGMSFSANE
jgi:hypothetical protein